MGEGTMNRRGFFNVLLAVLGSTAVGSFVYPFLRFITPAGNKEKSKHITIKKAEIPSGKAIDLVLNETPIIVINRPGRGYIAFSKVCTHLGCLVEYDSVQKKLLCPCHAGLYDLEGSVVSGPPPNPLPTIVLRIEGENIVIG